MRKLVTLLILVLFAATVAHEQSNMGGGASINLAAPGPIGGGTPAAGTFTNLTSTAAGDLSTGNGSAVSITGAPITGGSGTTTVPLVYLNSGNAPTTFNTNGTEFGINAPSGFTGNFLHFAINGGNPVFRISNVGTITTGGGIQIGGSSAYIMGSGHIAFSSTAPTIAGAGCGGSGATISVNNGTASFSIGVGSTPTTGCTVTMPAATTDWNCSFTDATTQSTSVFLQKQSTWGQTTAAFTNWNTAGSATNLGGSDVIHVICAGE